jgi:hypothetical protein
MTLSVDVTHFNECCIFIVLPSVVMLSVVQTKCHCAECRSDECCGTVTKTAAYFQKKIGTFFLFSLKIKIRLVSSIS